MTRTTGFKSVITFKWGWNRFSVLKSFQNHSDCYTNSTPKNQNWSFKDFQLNVLDAPEQQFEPIVPEWGNDIEALKHISRKYLNGACSKVIPEFEVFYIARKQYTPVKVIFFAALIQQLKRLDESYWLAFMRLWFSKSKKLRLTLASLLFLPSPPEEFLKSSTITTFSLFAFSSAPLFDLRWNHYRCHNTATTITLHEWLVQWWIGKEKISLVSQVVEDR